MVNVCISCVWGRRSIIDPDMLQFLHGSGHVFEVGFSSILYFSLQDIDLTLGLLPCRKHVIWRDSAGVGSSRLGLKSLECAGYSPAELLSLSVTPY